MCLIMLSINCLAQKPLPIAVRNDFSIAAYQNFNYGKGSFRSIIVRGLSSEGYGLSDIAVMMETLDKKPSNLYKVLSILHHALGNDKEFLFANLNSLGMSASNANYLSWYILDKSYQKQPTKEEIAKTERKRLEDFNLEKGKRMKDYKEKISSLISGITPVSISNLSLSQSNADYGLPTQIEVNTNHSLKIMTDSLLKFFQSSNLTEEVSFVFNKKSLVYAMLDQDNKNILLTTEQSRIVNSAIKLENDIKITYNGITYPVEYETVKFKYKNSHRSETVSYFFEVSNDNSKKGFFSNPEYRMHILDLNTALGKVGVHEKGNSDYTLYDSVISNSEFYKDLAMKELYNYVDDKSWREVPFGTSYYKMQFFKTHFSKSKNILQFKIPALYRISLIAQFDVKGVYSYVGDEETMIINTTEINKNSFSLSEIRVLNTEQNSHELQRLK